MVCLLLMTSCSPIPGKYGYIDGVTREHSLDEMKVDIKTGNIFWVSAQCNKEEWKQGDGLSNVLWFPFTLGFRGGAYGSVDTLKERSTSATDTQLPETLSTS